MKRTIFTALLLSLLSIFSLEAQHFTHVVNKGETLYSLSRMYHVAVDEIVALNPTIEGNIIGQGAVVRIPQSEAAATQEPDNNYLYHTIKPKETLFSLAQTYHTTIESIIQENPGLSPINFTIGKVVRIAKGHDVTLTTPPSPLPTTTEEVTTISFEKYTAKRRDSFESIAQKFDLTVEQIRESNPRVKRIERGDVIYIPTYHVEEVVVAVDTTQYIDQIYHSISTPQIESEIEVALLLPFMLDDESNRTAPIYIEFYEGFLLAVDQLKQQGISITVYAYDTAGSESRVREILAKPELAEVDLIIAPERDQLITLVSNFAKSHDINMVNAFSLKNEEVVHNNRVFQTNIPHSYLYAEAVDEFIARYRDKEIIFLQNEIPYTDKREFLDLLKSNLTQQNIAYTTFKYTQTEELVRMDSLLQIAPGEIVVLPESGQKSLLDAQISPLAQLAELCKDSIQVNLFGYPEWQMYTSEYINHYFALNTTIYSRFYASPLDQDTKAFYEKFKYWYSKDLILANPRYGILGYDTGLFFLEAVRKYGRNFETQIEGATSHNIQTDFKFQRVNNWSGFINKNIYFINFNPNFTIDKEMIQ